jgi:CubicO group peptidase (beta-lactamase class C family)
MAPVVRNATGRVLGAALVLATVVAVAACSDDDSSEGTAADADPASGAGGAGDPGPPADPGAWVVEAPEDHELDPATLERARTYAFAEGRNTQGVVVVRDGVIVAEWYADGAGPDSWVASWSVAKSFTSATVGIAIEEGLIPGVDEPMTTWYPEFAGTERGDMTLRDVLQMGSGLDWVEDYDPAAVGESDIIRLVTGESDQLAYSASRPAAVTPGSRFSYSSGDTMLLSGVIEQAVGMPADAYAAEVLFEPLGLDRAEWWRDAAGHTLTYCCFDSTSRDFARFGQLYLQGGRWGDEQVVPEQWVEDSLVPSDASEAAGDPYGYQWWLGEPEGIDENVFAAVGHDGQWIYVIPDLDMVVVRSGTYVKNPGPPVADPILFPLYPSDGLIPGQGTAPPDDWDTTAFLAPIIASAQG